MLKINKKLLFLPLIICIMLATFCTFGFAGCSTSKVTVTLDANGGYFVVDGEEQPTYTIEIDAGQQVKIDDIIIPQRDSSNTTNYEFDGWSYDVSQPITQDIEIKAVWTSKERKYTVTFDANGGVYGNKGEEIEKQYSYSAVLTPPTNPTRASDNTYDYTFKGYNTTVANTVTQDVTYTAQWEQVYRNYTVIFDANGGSIQTGTANVDSYQQDGLHFGAAIALPTGYTMLPQDPSVEKEYKFDGWYDARSGGSKVNTVPNHTTTVYAHWKEVPREYTITFSAGTGKFSDGKNSVATCQMKYGDTITVPQAWSNPKMADTNEHTYSFQGYNIPANATVTGDATYTAIYAESTRYYSVTFNAGDGTYSDGSKQIKVSNLEYNKPISLPTQEPSRTPTVDKTYTFNGYTGFVQNGTKVTGDNMSFTASYTESTRKYNITLLAGGSQENAYFGSNNRQEVLQLEYGANIYDAVVEYVPTKKSTAEYVYTFAGYTGLTQTASVTGDSTYSASYTATTREYTVTFDANGGKFTTSEEGDVFQITQTVKYGEQANFSLVGTPTKESDSCYDYTYKEWSAKANSSQRYDSIIKGDTTYYAWYSTELREYTVTFWNVADKDKSTVLYTTKYTASPQGTPELDEDQMKALNKKFNEADDLRKYDYDGFAGQWDFTLRNSNTSFEVGGSNSVYKFGDGSDAAPYLINNLESFGAMYEKMQSFYSNYSAAGVSDEMKGVYIERARELNYKMIADVDFSGYDSLDDEKKASYWFIGNLDATKSSTENYALRGLDPKFFSKSYGMMFMEMRDAKVTNLDIYLGEKMVSFAYVARGTWIEFNNVNIYNEDGVTSTFVSSDDNNESAYVAHTMAKDSGFVSCTNYANYTSEAAYFGIFLGGYSKDEAHNSTLTFNNCVNYGDVLSSDSVGMLTGNPAYRCFPDDYSNNLYFYSCVNYGNITARGVGGFVGFAGSGVNATMKAELDQKVTNGTTSEGKSGSMNIMPTLNATLATSKAGTNAGKFVLTAKSGNTFDAGRYVLTVVAFAQNSEDNSTVRVNYSFTKDLTSSANSINFTDGYQYDFIDKDSYKAYIGVDPSYLTGWQSMTGYSNIKYALDEVNRLIVFDFSEFDDGTYTLNPENATTAFVTYYDTAGKLSASNTFSVASIHAKVSTETALHSAIQGKKSYITLGESIVLNTEKDTTEKAFAVIKDYTLNLNLNDHGLIAQSAIESIFVVGENAQLNLYVANVSCPAASESETVISPAIINVEEINAGKTETIEISAIEEKKNSIIATYNNFALRVMTGGELNVMRGVTVQSDNSYTIMAKGQGATVNVLGGTVECIGQYAAISGNGNSENSGITINIDGGKITSKEVAIYMPGGGNLTIDGGATVEGDLSGIYIKAGIVNINDATITSKGSKVTYDYWNSGYNATGDAIVIDSCGYPQGPANVTISNQATINVKADSGCAQVAHYINTELVDATKTEDIATIDSAITPVVVYCNSSGVVTTTPTTGE